MICYNVLALASTGDLQNDVASTVADGESVPWGVPDFMCGPRCLWQIAHVYGKEHTLNSIARMAGTDLRQGTTVSGMLNACRKMDVEAIAVKTNIRLLATDPRVAILLAETKDANHFVILDSVNGNSVRLLDGCTFRDISVDKLNAMWNGYAILIGASDNHTTDWIQLASGRALQVIGIAALLGLVAFEMKHGWWRIRSLFTHPDT